MTLKTGQSVTFITLLLACLTAPALQPAPDKEFLTPKEIEKIQDAQEIEQRIKVYMEAATLRLKTAVERLGGKESEEGDPLEFFTVQDMIDGYYRIMKSVMANLDEAYQRPDSDKAKLGKALKNVKDTTEWAGKILVSLKKTAEDKKDEDLWNAVNRAIDITGGLHDGVELGLQKNPAPPEKGKRKRN